MREILKNLEILLTQYILNKKMIYSLGKIINVDNNELVYQVFMAQVQVEVQYF